MQFTTSALPSGSFRRSGNAVSIHILFRCLRGKRGEDFGSQVVDGERMLDAGTREMDNLPAVT